MHRLYGTFLTHLVEQALRESAIPLSAREIAMQLIERSSERDRWNLECRVRRALKDLEQENKLLKEKHRIRLNLVCFKYKIHQHEQIH